MMSNIGDTDRIFRVIFGAALIVGGFLVTGTAGMVMGAIGLIPLATGAAGNCPIYTLLKTNTCKQGNT